MKVQIFILLGQQNDSLGKNHTDSPVCSNNLSFLISSALGYLIRKKLNVWCGFTSSVLSLWISGQLVRKMLSVRFGFYFFDTKSMVGMIFSLLEVQLLGSTWTLPPFNSLYGNSQLIMSLVFVVGQNALVVWFSACLKFNYCRTDWPPPPLPLWPQTPYSK